ncbi:uracil-DNA glycosylase family protein [Paenibacillus eucommiae]|uniref:Uracil-DNA glycosylase n=1 Tax=Paenibacillus eucommiae TaxID=1355755 RepID=A0ABS4J9R7_9BACL|nr:uracil-DNA glycosylase family protein [Paenibacillus eucommiae]MBP1995816.1 uracil-DNA glycosylase [Paenibacillus eucommiae]
MLSVIRELFQQNVFSCTECRTSRNNTNFFNPYCEANPRHQSSRPQIDIFNRQNFFLDYISSRYNVKIMVIGEAPGLDGCGFSGIAFTSEYNAVSDLELPNYHRTFINFQREDSAEFLYDVFCDVADVLDVDLKSFCSQLYLTNASLCVPLNDRGTGVIGPSTIMKNNCKKFLKEQIEAIQPEYILTLGAKSFNAVVRIMDVAGSNNIRLKDIPSLCDCIERDLSYRAGTTLIIPELHPSSNTNLNEKSKRLYPELKSRIKRKLLGIFNE